MTRLDALLQETPYSSYAYSYPHKTAYRPLQPPVPLREAWKGERREALFLYLHVPFCEMRCGFCNLFTTANPREELERRYLEALRRQARRVRDALGPVGIARAAIGGGTPTYLGERDLEALFEMAEQVFGVDWARIPVSVETSPLTAEPGKLRLLREWGVDRISIGVQSFIEAEVAAAGRAQRRADVEAALERIRAGGFATLNVDLIYGLPGQTVASWLASLHAALRFAPEELYLYPLYVRPLTGLDRRHASWDDQRLACYRAGRELLLAAGYVQVSMRMFRLRIAARGPAPAAVAFGAKTRLPRGLRIGDGPPTTDHRPPGDQIETVVVGGRSSVVETPHSALRNPQSGPVYCCQEDGMIGLGCGARSYTQALHYATEYAVGARGVRAILEEYVSRPEEAFDGADYGVALDGEEQRRRYVIKSLLQVDGLGLREYRDWFGTDALEDLPELAELEPRGLAMCGEGRLRLTAAGLERSDTIGPWLYSETMRGRAESFALQ